MMSKVIFCLLAASSTVPSVSECQGASCKAEVPQDEVSLVQTKLEGLKKVDGPQDLDLDSATEELHNYVKDLKQSMTFNMTAPEDLAFSKSCPVGFTSEGEENTAIFSFVNKCLESVDVKELSETEMGKLASCAGRAANDIVPGQAHGLSKNEINMVTKNQLQNGGICNAKVYKVKCRSGKATEWCQAAKLYRGYTKQWATACKDSTGYDCAKPWGSFWAAVNPTGMSKKDYRERYAVCEGWNAHLDGVWEANIGENTMCGSYILIGNGEMVKDCPKPITKGSERYEYSPYLQVVTCKYPQEKWMAHGTDLPVAGWN
jgi:hypothetical protein